MKKQRMVFISALIFTLLLSTEAFAAESVMQSKQNLTVNGKEISCDKYNIGGSNYFKLRDLAKLLNGTDSQFSVGYDSETNSVKIVKGEAYIENGSELAVGKDYSSTAKPSQQSIIIDGEVSGELSVYNIGGNNFFKLRDLGDALSFYVDYNAETNTALVASGEYKEIVKEDALLAGIPDNQDISKAYHTKDALQWSVQRYEASGVSYATNDFMYAQQYYIIDGEIYTCLDIQNEYDYLQPNRSNLPYFVGLGAGKYTIQDDPSQRYDKLLSVNAQNLIRFTKAEKISVKGSGYFTRWTIAFNGKTLSNTEEYETGKMLLGGDVRTLASPIVGDGGVAYYVNVNDVLHHFGISGNVSFEYEQVGQSKACKICYRK